MRVLKTRTVIASGNHCCRRERRERERERERESAKLKDQNTNERSNGKIPGAQEMQHNYRSNQISRVLVWIDKIHKNVHVNTLFIQMKSTKVQNTRRIPRIKLTPSNKLRALEAYGIPICACGYKRWVAGPIS